MAVAYVTGGQGEEAAAANSHTISIDTGSTGADRILEVTLVGRVNPDTLSSVQYAGSAMASVVDVGPYLKSYRIVAPATGANNLTFTSSAFDRFQYAWKVFEGVDQTSPTGTAVTVSSTATTDRSTGSVTCPTGGMVIGSMADDFAPTNNVTGVAGTVIGWHQNGNARITTHSYRNSTGALTWTTDNLGFDWWCFGVPLNAAGGAASVEQEGFRFGIDDGAEGAHTWAAAQDADITAPAGETRLLNVLVNVTGDPGAKTFKLQYRKVGDPGWSDVPIQ